MRVTPLTLKGHELHILKQGRTDSPVSTSFYVPSISLIVAGDVVYNQCTCTSATPLTELDRGPRLTGSAEPGNVIAGHKYLGAPDSALAVHETKRYLEDFDWLQKTAASDQELFG
jgi:hypothetical protein